MPQGVQVRVPLPSQNLVDSLFILTASLLYYLYMRQDILEKENDIRQWIKEGWSFAEMYRELGCARDTLYGVLKKLGITYKGNQGLKQRKHDTKRKTYQELIQAIENGSYITNQKLRLRLIEDEIKEAKCELCGRTHWMDKPIPLELHHADMNHHNNKLENLKVLCSNCHSYVHKYNIIL